MTMEKAWRNLFGVLFCCTLVRSNVCHSYNILPPETALKTEGFSTCGLNLMFFSLQNCEGELLTDLLGKKLSTYGCFQTKSQVVGVCYFNSTTWTKPRGYLLVPTNKPFTPSTPSLIFSKQQIKTIIPIKNHKQNCVCTYTFNVYAVHPGFFDEIHPGNLKWSIYRKYDEPLFSVISFQRQRSTSFVGGLTRHHFMVLIFQHMGQIFPKHESLGLRYTHLGYIYIYLFVKFQPRCSKKKHRLKCLIIQKHNTKTDTLLKLLKENRTNVLPDWRIFYQPKGMTRGFQQHAIQTPFASGRYDWKTRTISVPTWLMGEPFSCQMLQILGQKSLPPDHVSYFNHIREDVQDVYGGRPVLKIFAMKCRPLKAGSLLKIKWSYKLLSRASYITYHRVTHLFLAICFWPFVSVIQSLVTYNWFFGPPCSVFFSTHLKYMGKSHLFVHRIILPSFFEVRRSKNFFIRTTTYSFHLRNKSIPQLGKIAGGKPIWPNNTSWWFQPLWKILVKLGIFPT